MSSPIKFISSERIESYCSVSHPGQISISGDIENGQGTVRLLVGDYTILEFTNTDDVYKFFGDLLVAAAVLQRK